MKNTGKIKSELLLFLTAFIWGAAFVAQSVGGDAVGCFTFNGARCLIGGVVLIPVIFFLDSRKKNVSGGAGFEKPKAKDWTWMKGGICCGLLLCIASNFQQVGISMTTVGKAGFITAMYILMVPIFGIFVRKKAGWKVWLGVVLAAAGLYMLCMTSEKFTLSKGDFYVLISAFFFTIHILIIDHFSPKCDGVRMSCVQFLVCGMLSMILAFVFETPNMGALLAGWKPLLYAGVLSCGLGYTLQIVGQKNTDPTVASLILSLESVFSVVAGWFILDQTLSVRELFGCVLMLFAIVLAQLPDGKIDRSFLNFGIKSPKNSLFFREN